MTSPAEGPVTPDPAAAADAASGPAVRRSAVGKYVLGTSAAILGVVLLVLVGVLWWTTAARPDDLGPVRGGLKATLVLTGPGTGAKPKFSQPMGVAFANDGSIFVADTGNDRIVAFDPQGRYLFEVGGKGIAKPLPGVPVTWKPGLFNYPMGLSVGPGGQLYVADFYNNQIQVLSASGKPLRAFPDPNRMTGRGGSGIDNLGIAVTDVAVSGGRVWATDTWQIFGFTPAGKVVAQFGRPGTGPGDLNHPTGIAVAPDGTLYVADSDHSRVVAFAPDGKPRWVVGRVRKSLDDRTPSEFQLPRDVAVTGRGTVLVVDAFDFRIVELSATGKVLGRYGVRGSDPGQLDFPTAIAVKGDLVAVAEKANDRVQVLRLVGRR